MWLVLKMIDWTSSRHQQNKWIGREFMLKMCCEDYLALITSVGPFQWLLSNNNKSKVTALHRRCMFSCRQDLIHPDDIFQDMSSQNKSLPLICMQYFTAKTNIQMHLFIFISLNFLYFHTFISHVLFNWGLFYHRPLMVTMFWNSKTQTYTKALW